MFAKLYFLLQIIQINAFKFFTFHEILKKKLAFYDFAYIIVLYFV